MGPCTVPRTSSVDTAKALVFGLLFVAISDHTLFAQDEPRLGEGQRYATRESRIGMHVDGVFPHMTVMADRLGSDSEAGVGALIPWANKLWAVGYVSHIRGRGLGLYEIDENMTMRWHPASVTGTFANIDALWQMGKPSGWGGPWWKTPVEAGQVSDPFLMTGFDKKGLHLAHDSDATVSFRIEVDFLGDGTWKRYRDFQVQPTPAMPITSFPTLSLPTGCV